MPVSVPVDFTGVEARKSVKVPEGDYVAKLVKIEQTKAKSSGNPMLVCDFEFRSGGKGVEGQKIRDRHILTKESLWTLRNMLECMGLKVPNGKMNLQEKQIKGRQVGLTIVDGEEYRGRIRSEIADYLPVEAVGQRVSGEDAEPDEDDWEDDDDLEDEDVEDEDLGWEDEDEEDDEDEDEDDEEEDDEPEWEDDDEDDDDDDEVEEGDEETEEVELSFDEDDVKNAKGPDLKGYITEAKEAGWEFDLPAKPKVADVREALLALFEDEDDDELEGFDLDDVE